MQILLTDLPIFLMVLVGRSCLNIKTISFVINSFILMTCLKLVAGHYGLSECSCCHGVVYPSRWRGCHPPVHGTPTIGVTKHNVDISLTRVQLGIRSAQCKERKNRFVRVL